MCVPTVGGFVSFLYLKRTIEKCTAITFFTQFRLALTYFESLDHVPNAGLNVADKAEPRWWSSGEEAGRPPERERPRLPAHGDHLAAAAQRHEIRRCGDRRDPGPDGHGRGVRRGRRGGGRGRAVRGVFALCGRHATPSRVRAPPRDRRRARRLMLPPDPAACRSQLSCCPFAVLAFYCLHLLF
jgi:hypothetical protein